MKEFFGFGGYTRPAEGFLSWQHIVFVSTLVAIMTVLAVFLGKRYKNRDDKAKNKIIIISAILIDAFEIFKLIIVCARSGDASALLYDLPLFFCSIQLITLPVAAFSRGRIKEAALDFIFICGLLGALLGTYGAGNNYGSYPVLSFDNVVSGITHCISGFASLYIGISGMAGMKKENAKITYSILLVVSLVAYITNHIIDYNYMFLMRGDGTPYDIFYNLLGGNKVLYPICVVLLFVLYFYVFYAVFYLIKKRKELNTGK